MARSVDGDLRSFGVLVDRHSPALRADARRHTGRHADADDVVQEACVAAWMHLAELEEGTAVLGWLFRIVSRTSFDALRRRHLRKRGSGVDGRTIAVSFHPDGVSTSLGLGHVPALASLAPGQPYRAMITRALRSGRRSCVHIR